MAAVQKRQKRTNNRGEIRVFKNNDSYDYQRLYWDALQKSIKALFNKVSAANLKHIIPEFFSENLVRGRGLLCQSCITSQIAYPSFTHVFAALISVVNSKFPPIGHLLLKRVVLLFKREFMAANSRLRLLASAKFIAHLVNQLVAHEIVALQLLALLLECPTYDSVEVAVSFVTECGATLQELSPKGLDGVFERLRGILHEGDVDKRVRYLIETLFAIRKAKFKGYPSVLPELDLVDPEDQLTHEVSLLDDIDPEINLNFFKPDPNFLANEEKFDQLKKSILGDDGSDDEGQIFDPCDVDSEEDCEIAGGKMKIWDETESDVSNLRRTIYIVTMNSISFEECGHKLLQIIEPGQEMELCIMVLECCLQEKAYRQFYGFLGQRFCMVEKVYRENFEKCFVDQYSKIHRLGTNEMRNVAMFFAHLLVTDALTWHILAYIRLTEEDTTSSSRIFVKFLFQEVCERLGIGNMIERLKDSALQESLESVFRKDSLKNARFSINFFTSIGLGAVTENLRTYMKNTAKTISQQQNDPGADSSSRKRCNKGDRDEKSKMPCRRY